VSPINGMECELERWNGMVECPNTDSSYYPPLKLYSKTGGPKWILVGQMVDVLNFMHKWHLLPYYCTCYEAGPRNF